MPSAGFKIAIPANEWPQTCAVDSAATAIGHWTSYTTNIKTGLQFTSTLPYTVPAMPQCPLSYHNGKAALLSWRVCVYVCVCVVGLCLRVPCFRDAICLSFSTPVLGIISTRDLEKKLAWPWPSRDLLLRHSMWASYHACGEKGWLHTSAGCYNLVNAMSQ